MNSKKILIINGPNMNLLGIREPELYGKEDYNALTSLCQETCQGLGVECECFQSNHEGAIIDRIQETLNDGTTAIVINAAGYSHTSIAIMDALKAVKLPTVEVHITDPKSREPYRHHSFISEASIKTIAGLGIAGYKEAILFLLSLE